MANYNEHKCLACGQIFEYCRRCVITPVIHKAEGFCSEKCSDIFNILSKHGCNIITADATLKELSAYNLDEISLNEGILAHIKAIKSEVNGQIEETVDVKAEAEIAPIAEETTIINQLNKNNNKKKW